MPKGLSACGGYAWKGCYRRMAPQVQQKFPIAFAPQNGADRKGLWTHFRIREEGPDLAAHPLMYGGIAHNASTAHIISTGFELGFNE